MSHSNRAFEFLVVLLFSGMGFLGAMALHFITEAGTEANEEGGRGEWEFQRLRDPSTGTIPAGIRARELAFASQLPRAGRDRLSRGTSAVEIGWNWHGPVNIGGRTRAFGTDVRGEDTIIAGGVSGGLWRSSDRGRTWHLATLPNQLPAISCLAQDIRPGHEDIWYAGTGELLGASQSAVGAYYLGDGVYKTTDNGRSWEQIPATVSNSPHAYDRGTDLIWSVATDPSSSDTSKVYLATAGAILRSTDAGTTWRSVLTSSPSAYFCDLTISRGGVIYATFSYAGFGDTRAGRRGVYRSTNGTTWTFIGPPFFPDSTRRIVAATAPSNERVAYFVAETPHSGKAGRDFLGDSVWCSIWKYTYDSGNGSGSGGRWEDLSGSVPSFGGSFGDFNPQSSYDISLAVHPRNENIVVVGGTNLYRTSNGFKDTVTTAWIGGYRNIRFNNEVIIPLEYPNHHPDQHRVVFSLVDSSTLYSASDGGVHYTSNFLSDSVEWTSLNNGYGTSQFHTIAYYRGPSGTMLLLGGMQDNGTWSTSSDDASDQWSVRGTGDGSYCAIVDDARTLYVSKQLGKTYRVDLDEHGGMTSFARIDPIGATGYRFINPFVPDPLRPHLLYMLGGTRVWRNSDVTAIPAGNVDSVATNWVSLDGTNGGATLTALAVSTLQPAHRIWYGNDSGRVYRADDADGGSPDVIDVTGQGFPNRGYVNCIAVDPTNGNRAAVVFSNYNVLSIFLTTDGGSTWAPIGGNLEQYANGTGNGPSIRWFTFAPQGGGTYFLVGASTGLYSTTRLDGMNTVWEQEGSSTIGNVPVDMMAVADDGQSIAAATHGRGVFTAMLPTLSVGTQGTSPESPVLTVTPNPARDFFTVSWNLNRPLSLAVLSFYDLRGHRLRSIEAGQQPNGIGKTRVDISGSNAVFVPGMYFARLEWEGGSIAREVRIVR